MEGNEFINVLISERSNVKLEEELEQPIRVFKDRVKLSIPDCEFSHEIRGEFLDVKLNFEMYEDDNESVKTIGNQVLSFNISDPNKKHNLIHDFTFGIITTDKERRLSSVFGALGDGDTKTPDLMITSEDGVIVSEFGTSASSYENHLKQKFVNKLLKYRGHLLRRQRMTAKDVYFSVIIVGEEAVCTNLLLDDLKVAKLCLRYKFIKRVFDSYLRKLNLNVFSEEDRQDDELVKAVTEEFDTLRLIISDNDIYPELNDRHYENWLTPPSLENLNDVLINMSKESLKEFEESTFVKGPIGVEIKKYGQKIHNEAYEENLCSAKSVCDEYERKYQERVSSHSRMKPIAKFPFLTPSQSLESDTTVLNDLIEDFLGTKTAYQTALFEILWGYVDKALEKTENEIIEEEINSCNGGYEKDPVGRRVNRVIYEAKDEFLIEIAKQGVLGKKNSDNPEVSQHRDFRSKPFPLDQDVSDISLFINDGYRQMAYMCENSTNYMNLFEEIMKNSIKINVHDDFDIDELLGPWHFFTKTALFSHCSFISDLGTELCLSLKQNCKENEWIVKRLRGRDVFMIVKPTRMQEHIFFCLFYDSSTCENVFEDCTVFPETFESPNGRWKYTKFYSANISKLTNWVSADSRMFSLYCMLLMEREQSLDFESQEFKDDEPSESQRYIWKSLSLLYTLMIDDKSETETTMMLLRYISMEGLIEPPIVPRPQRLFCKMPSFFKGRMGVWVYQRLKEHIFQIAEGGIYWSERTTTQDNKEILIRRNLYSHFINEKLTNLLSLIQHFYIPYIKNKDEESARNGDFRITSKMIEYEMKFNETMIGSVGISNKTDAKEMNFFEYNQDVIKQGTDLIKIRLKKTLGPSWREMLGEKILKSLAHETTTEVLSTLKASGRFPYDDDENHTKEKRHPRKLVEAAKEFIFNDKQSIGLHIKECMKRIEKGDGAHCNTFPKKQHGGDREIYVLSAEERIVQYCFEKMAHIICKQLKEEITSNPKNENSIFRQHGDKMKDSKADRYSTYGFSNDASKWSQSHYLTKFGMMMCRLLPKRFHVFIRNSISLFLRRRIYLSEDVIGIMDSNPNFKSYDPVIQELYDNYSGNKTGQNVHWIKPKQNYVKTRTGMMQGIFHKTSSLFHCCAMEFCMYSLIPVIKKSLCYEDKGGKKRERSVVETRLITSDDSAIILSIENDKTRDATIPCSLYLFSIQLKKLMRYFGIFMSEKSVGPTPKAVEFKSRFMFADNIYEPYIKILLACLSISEQTTFVGKFEEYYNLSSSLLQSGGGNLLVFYAKVSQCLMHYKTLGLYASNLFHSFAKKQIVQKNPYAGYFLFDHPFLSGIMGFDYNLWISLKHNNLGNLFKINFISKKEKRGAALEKEDQEEQDPFEILNGSLMRSIISLNYGDSEKAKTLLDRLGIFEEDIETVREDPYLMIRRPITESEARGIVSLKMFTRSTINSINCGNGISKAMTECAYILRNKSLKFHDEYFNSYVSQMEYSGIGKCSLLYVLTQTGKVKPDQTKDFLKQNEMKQLFPNLRSYQVMYDVQIAIQSSKLVKTITTYKRKKFDLGVFNEEEEMIFSFKDIALESWFAKETSYIDKTTRRNLIKHYQEIYPWFKESWQESLKESFFHDSIEMMTFLEKTLVRSRTIHFGSANTNYKSRGESVKHIIRNNCYPGYMPESLLKNQVSSVNFSTTGTLGHYFYLLSALPFKKDIYNVFEDSRTPLVKNFITLCSINNKKHGQDPLINIDPRHQTLQILSRVASEQGYLEGESHELIRLQKDLISCKKGIIGSYKVRQKFGFTRDNQPFYSGPGIWTGKIMGKSTIIFIDGTDKKTWLKSVVMDINKQRISELSHIQKAIQHWCKENHVLNDVITLTTRAPRSLLGVEYCNASDVIVSMLEFEINTRGCPVYSMNPDHKNNSIFIMSKWNFDIEITNKKGRNVLLRLVDRATDEEFVDSLKNTEEYFSAKVDYDKLKRRPRFVPYMLRKLLDHEQFRKISRRTVVLSYTSTHKEYKSHLSYNWNEEINSEFPGVIVKRWLNNESLTISELSKLSKSLKTSIEYNDFAYDPSEFEEFMKNMTRNTLMETEYRTKSTVMSELRGKIDEQWATGEDDVNFDYDAMIGTVKNAMDKISGYGLQSLPGGAEIDCIIDDEQMDDLGSAILEIKTQFEVQHMRDMTIYNHNLLRNLSSLSESVEFKEAVRDLLINNRINGKFEPLKLFKIIIGICNLEPDVYQEVDEDFYEGIVW